MKKIAKHFKTIIVLMCFQSAVNAQNPFINIDSLNNVSCFGLSDGDIFISGSGGTPPLTYLWNTGVTTDDITNIPAGTYTITVTDNASNTATASYSISQPPQLNVSISTLNSVSCNGFNDGEICINATGGIAPYIYLWSQGSTTQCIQGLSVGTYSITVMDDNGCSATTMATITEPTPVIIDSIAIVPASCGMSDGDAFVYPSGGTPPYLYLWSGSQTTQWVTGLTAGVYTVIVTDANGCSITEPVVINNPNAPIIIIDSIYNVSCFGNSNGAIFITSTGGNPPFSFIWSNGATTEEIINLVAGVYSITITDANNCWATISAAVTEPPPLTLTPSITNPSCGMADGSICVFVSGGVSLYTYLWAGLQLTPCISGLASGVYTVTVTDANACTLVNAITLGCDSVWPGDANNDGTANNNDLLAIGIGYSSTGPVRPGATINWTGQVATDWADTLAAGTNYKHIDCNGDGTINDADTVAIIQNYGLTHPLRLAAPLPSSLLDPYLAFDFSVDTVNTNQQIEIPVLFGSAAIPAIDIYGLAFTINYDTSLVKADSVSITFSPSWIGTVGTDLIGIGKNIPLNGQLDVGMTRIDHNNISGFGEIARVTVVTTDNVSGRIMSTLFDTLSFSFSDVTIIDANENPKAFNIENTDVIIQDSTTSIEEVFISAQIKIYPNPAKDKLFIKIPPGYLINEVDVTNIVGEKLKVSSQHKNNLVEITNLETFSTGIYFIKIKTDKGMAVKKFSVVR